MSENDTFKGIHIKPSTYIIGLLVFILASFIKLYCKDLKNQQS